MNLSVYIKSLFDLLFGLIFFIILLPVFIIIGILIKLDSKGPVFFTQERIGKNEKNFVIYKFRSMVDKAEKIGLGRNLSKDDSRITKLGDFLRNWSLDELPQIINIVKVQGLLLIIRLRLIMISNEKECL